MKPTTLSRCCGVITGPKSFLALSKAPTFRFSIAFVSPATSLSPISSPTATATDNAMQRSPDEPNAAPISELTALSRSASGMTMAWFLAPPSAWQRFPCAVAVAYTYSAIGVEPTKLTACTRGSVSRVSTASLSPLTRLNTPSGKPACCSSSATSRVAPGSRSDGLRTKVLPHTMASGNIHNGTIAGKLNGVMPATTPSGWNSLHESMPGPTLRVYSLLSSCGAAQANSTFSMPRCSSPAASWAILPCSRPISSQILSAFCSSKSR